MVIVRFPDEATHVKALGFLIGRFSGHSWATGEVLISEEALAPMARDGFTFTVEGLAHHKQIRSLRKTPPIAV
jgi:hypothetical protein